MLLVENHRLSDRTPEAVMTVLGQSRPNWAVSAMSGLPPIATELRTSRNGSFVPIRDIARLV